MNLHPHSNLVSFFPFGLCKLSFLCTAGHMLRVEKAIAKKY